MAKHTLWFIANQSHEKSRTSDRRSFTNTKLKYNTHIDLSYQIAAKRLRTFSFYQ